MAGIAKMTEMALLLDFYGDLLTPKQREFMGLYYFEDLSLNEIAEQAGITPQAVSDLLKRTVKILTGYERKLKLLEKHRAQREKADALINRVKGMAFSNQNDKQFIIHGLISLLD